jgi:hypothetical protein
MQSLLFISLLDYLAASLNLLFNRDAYQCTLMQR